MQAEGSEEPATADLQGVAFNALTEGQVVEVVLGGLKAGRGGRVVTPNIDILYQVAATPDLRFLVTTADLVLADGMPIVWASRLIGRALPERVAGSALAPRLVEQAAREGLGVFLLGGNPGSAEIAAHRLGVAHSGLRTGFHCPPFGFEDDEGAQQAIYSAVRAFGPALYLVGLGFPKQDRLGADLLRQFPESWFVGAGATIGFLAGEFDRAPRWMQLAGLEWLHRLLLEPSRLAQRYLRHDIPFALRLLGRSTAEGARRRIAQAWEQGVRSI